MRPPKKSAKPSFHLPNLHLHLDVKKWFSIRSIEETFLEHPKRQLVVTGIAVLLCLYIALIAAAGQEKKPDDTILTTGIALEDVFTQKTMRTVRTRMELEETAIIYIYAAPSVTVDDAGNITAFSLSLATTEKNKYSLWNLIYRPETSTLHLELTEDGLSLKKLEFDLTQLPTEDIIKTFSKFPAKYVTQIYPISEGSVYQFVPASTPAVLNFGFGDEVSTGVPGLWISRSGGGSVIDGSFVPTGEYLTYRCTCTDTTGIDLEFLVMTEIQTN